MCTIQLHNMEFVSKCQYCPLPTKRGPKNWTWTVLEHCQKKMGVVMDVLSSKFGGHFA